MKVFRLYGKPYCDFIVCSYYPFLRLYAGIFSNMNLYKKLWDKRYLPEFYIILFFFKISVPVPSYRQFSDFKMKFSPQLIWKTAKDMNSRLIKGF